MNKTPLDDPRTEVCANDLNRAIVECVAKMQHALASASGTPPTEGTAK